MITMKSSCADCLSCPLFSSPSSLFDTNSKKDLSKVDVVFISEAPTKKDITKSKPLKGIESKEFRQYHAKYIKKDFKWLTSNVILCEPDDYENYDEIIDRCKTNVFEIIKQCKPKLIVLMGTNAMKGFSIAGGATNLRGNFFEWEDFDVFVTVNPSQIKTQPTLKEKFEQDMITIAEHLGASIDDKKTTEIKKGSKGVFRYKIPEKYYTSDYRLVDVQYLSKTFETLYIFRDKDNKKIYHKENDDYVCYQCPKGLDAKKVMSYDDLNQVTVSYQEKSKLDPNITYEGDMKLTSKHAMDYYHYNQEDAETLSTNILFMDIEVDTGINNRTFPEPSKALFPINMITCIYQQVGESKTVCYVVDNKTEPLRSDHEAEIQSFNDEKSMLLKMIKDWHDYDADFLAGWNAISFDMQYIGNRLPQLKINPTKLSKFGEFYVDAFRVSCKMPGTVVLDQDWLYKNFTFTKMENYKLGFIAQHELDGYTKIDLPLPFNEMYWKMFNLTVEYNIRDTVLLERLDEELKHINLLNEIRIICNSSFEGASSSFGQIDCSVISFLKTNGLASKNADPSIKKEKYTGAYVHPPKPGIYDDLTDFDFTSLYPSIIMTYNIGINSFVMRTVNPTDGYDIVYNRESLPDAIDVIIDPTFKAEEQSIKKEDIFKLMDEKKLICTINGCFYKSHEEEQSLYSRILESLLSSRRAYKKKMLDAKGDGDTKSKIFYNTKQLVYKVLANSLYGVVANKSFRFYDNACAGAITGGGQEAIKHSIVEGEAFMEYLDTGNEVKSIPLSKQEMYANTLPKRDTKYIVTGDTDSIFCCFQKFNIEKTVENIKSLCDQIQDHLNDDIIAKSVELHNVDLKYNKLDLKNELIISRGLFLAKKRYAIHVINNEGKTVDEMNYMGIEIKRSDYPSASKDFMKELLDLIMKTKSVSLSKLFKFIQKREMVFRQLIKQGDKSIARPCSYGKEIDEYKNIPQGVRAMEAFNSIVYNIHAPGSKGYMYRVSGFDPSKAPDDVRMNYSKFLKNGNKLEVIAIPDEESSLPDYFIPDMKANLKFSFVDRYNLMLAPLTEVKKDSGMLRV